VAEIVIVDNASKQDVIPAVLPDRTTVIRTPINIGPSSGVAAGLQYALTRDHEWFWLLDSDGAPHKDALQKLVELYESLDSATQNSVGILCCSQILLPSSKLFHGRRLTPGGPRLPKIDQRLSYCECDALMWNGALFRLDAVRAVGLPRLGRLGVWEDFSYDYGDMEFSYRIRAAGYKLLVHRSSLIDQRVGRSKQVWAFGRTWMTTNHPPDRRYLFFRNLVYFWLHLYPRRNWPAFSTWFLFRMTSTMLAFLLVEENRAAKMRACFAGIRDGIAGDLTRRYQG
jgi:GT2 family glycosyltransferase